MSAHHEQPRLERLRSKDVMRVDAARLTVEPIVAALMPARSTVYVRASGLCVVAVARGPVDCSAREGEFTIDRGHWLILPADSAPRLRAGPGALAAALMISDAVAVRDRHGLPMPVGRGRLQLSTLRLLTAALNACADVIPGKPPEGDAKGMLLDAIAHMSPPIEVIERCPGRTVQRKREIYGRLLRARLHIEGHPNEIPRVTDLADMSRFSSWYFTKAFTEVFGCSPQSYGRQFRLRHARRMLIGSSLSVAEVASACGFDNASAFARAFHQVFGATASEVRCQRMGMTQTNERVPVGARYVSALA